MISEQIQTEEWSSLKNKTSALGLEVSSGLQCPQGLAGPQRATPISPSIKSRLCGILPDHIHLPLGEKNAHLQLNFHRAKVLPT